MGVARQASLQITRRFGGQVSQIQEYSAAPNGSYRERDRGPPRTQRGAPSLSNRKGWPRRNDKCRLTSLCRGTVTSAVQTHKQSRYFNNVAP